MTEEDKYPRVTRNQLEIWLANPVTLNYLKCLEFEIEKLEVALSNEMLIDSANNDLSMNNIHSALGSKCGLRTAKHFEVLLNSYSMVEEKE
jgi:hypothetical protein